MNFESRVEKVLLDHESKEFLINQINIIRENTLDAEKRIAKCLVFILSLIGLFELINLKMIERISFFTAEIGKMQIVLLVIPVLISFYTYELFNQIILRKYLNTLFREVIKSKYKSITEMNLDAFLITHLSLNTEFILVNSKKNATNSLLEILTASFIVIFQYLPFIYCFMIYKKLLFSEQNKIFLIFSILITTLFFMRAILLFIAFIKDEGGLINYTKKEFNL